MLFRSHLSAFVILPLLPEIVVGDTISEHKAKVVELQKQIDEEKAFITKVELLKSQNVEPV